LAGRLRAVLKRRYLVTFEAPASDSVWYASHPG
jgi:hypothetical protein